MNVKNEIRYRIGRALGAFGYELRPAWKIPQGNIHPLNLAIDLLLARQGGSIDTVVQVGVFDGVTGDPLSPKVFKVARSIILIEPQPSCVHLLRERYKDDARVVVIDAAIADQEGEITLYAESGSSQRASVSRAHVEKFAGGHAAVSHQVKCITPLSLYRMFRDKAPDLLQVDTEGMDWTIIAALLGVGCFPRVVNFESFHLAEDQRRESRRLLAHYGYGFIEYQYDTCAVHGSLLK
jgi:FkbM family methyltransferase